MPLCEAAHYLVSLALQGNNSGETNKKVLAVETAHNIAVGQGDGTHPIKVARQFSDGAAYHDSPSLRGLNLDIGSRLSFIDRPVGTSNLLAEMVGIMRVQLLYLCPSLTNRSSVYSDSDVKLGGATA
jgi:hypothetical protein